MCSLSDYAIAYDVQVVTPTGIRKRRTIMLDRTNRVVYRVANVVRAVRMGAVLRRQC